MQRVQRPRGGRITGRATRPLFPACAALVWLCLAAPAAAPQPTDLTEQIQHGNRELQELRGRITDHREQLDALVDQEHDAAARLAHLVEEMGLLKNLLAGLDEREEMLRQRSEELQARLASHEETYAARQEALARHLRAMYVRGPGHNLELILTAGSFTDLVTRLRYTTLSARLESGFMAETRREGERILDEQRELRASLSGIWEAREEASQERRRLELLDEERRATLAGLQREREAAEARLAELQASEVRLTGVIAGLETRRRPSPPEGAATSAFARQAGRLEWPVSGRVVQEFGRSVHPVFKTVTVHNGLSIAADRGTPVYAVHAGQVEFADYLPGFGECVILDHGSGYYSLYAQLDRVYVEKGNPVAAGELLAEVGEATGEDGSQLYFEIRHGKTPLDPADWLQPRR